MKITAQTVFQSVTLRDTGVTYSGRFAVVRIYRPRTSVIGFYPLEDLPVVGRPFVPWDEVTRAVPE